MSQNYIDTKDLINKAQNLVVQIYESFKSIPKEEMDFTIKAEISLRSIMLSNNLLHAAKSNNSVMEIYELLNDCLEVNMNLKNTLGIAAKLNLFPIENLKDTKDSIDDIQSSLMLWLEMVKIEIADSPNPFGGINLKRFLEGGDC